jgi:hypothetical protein
MKVFVFAGLSAFLALSGVSAATAGASSYDGQWAVQLVTEKGTCDRALSWDVGVAASRIVDNNMLVQTTGGVDSQGRVTLLMTHGSDRVTASGKLHGASGAGAWNSPTRECSGHWSAMKRA